MKYLTLPWLIVYVIITAFVMLAVRKYSEAAFCVMLAAFGIWELILRSSDEDKEQRNRDKIERSKEKPNVARTASTK